jgi:hypothetical protein
MGSGHRISPAKVPGGAPATCTLIGAAVFVPGAASQRLLVPVGTEPVDTGWTLLRGTR